MTKKELMDLLVGYAEEYIPTAAYSLLRNSHMSDYKGEVVPYSVVEALIVDFVNYVGYRQGIDLGLYTSDLRKERGGQVG